MVTYMYVVKHRFFFFLVLIEPIYVSLYILNYPRMLYCGLVNYKMNTNPQLWLHYIIDSINFNKHVINISSIL